MSTQLSFPSSNSGVKNTFRWYQSFKKRNTFRRACRGQCKYKLWNGSEWMPPFQIYTEFNMPFTIQWDILDAGENVVFSPDPALLGMAIVGNLTYLYYKGDLLGYLFAQGYYTSEITITSGSNSVTWYSEEFYSIGYCSQGIQKVMTPDLCNLDDIESGIGSGSYSVDHDGCGICGDGAASPVIIVVPGSLSSQVSPYSVQIKTKNFLPGESLNIDLGSGSQFTVSSNGSFTFWGFSALDMDLIITSSPNWQGCIDFLQIESLSAQSIYKCHPVLVWYNDCGMMGEIYYGSSGYSNVFYMDEECEVIKPEPRIYQEGIENGEKDFFPTFQKRSTTYTIELGAVPDYVIEGLFEMAMHKFIKIYTDENSIDFIKNVSIKLGDPDELGGCLRLATMTFEYDDTTVAGACCDEIIPPDELPLRLLFDDIANVPVSDVNSLAEWNSFFDLPTYGIPFTSLSVSGNEVKLFGGADITFKTSRFSSNTHLIGVTDEALCVVSVDDNCFSNCTSINFFIGEAVLFFGSSCFFSCTALTTLTANAATFFDAGAFQNCTALVTASVDSGSTFSVNCFSGCSALTNFTNTGGVTFGGASFYGCVSLAGVLTLPNALSLDTAAFGSCNSLTGIVANLVMIIGDICFFDCTALVNVFIPYCNTLGTTTGDDGVFGNITGNTITLTILNATCTDGDVVALQAANTVTLICV